MSGSKLTKFGSPKNLGRFQIKADEVMYYLYYPVRRPNSGLQLSDSRLDFVRPLLRRIEDDEPERFWSEYVYLTIKKMYIGGGVTANRPGWHCDGFMSDDLNYIWYDNTPTVFNSGRFEISPDHLLSLAEFEQQARPENDYVLDNELLVKLDSTVIHRVNTHVPEQIMRTFVKITVSKERFNLKDNSKNPFLLLEGPLYDRQAARNDPHQAQRDSYIPPVVVDDHMI